MTDSPMVREFVVLQARIETLETALRAVLSCPAFCIDANLPADVRQEAIWVWVGAQRVLAPREDDVTPQGGAA